MMVLSSSYIYSSLFYVARADTGPGNIFLTAIKHTALFICLLGLTGSCRKKVDKKKELIIPVVQVEKYSLPGSLPQAYRTSLNPISFRPKLLNHQGKYWFAFLNHSKTALVLFSLENPGIVDSVKFPLGIQFTMMGNRDSLYYFIDMRNRKLLFYIQKNDSFVKQCSYPLPYVNKKDTYWVSQQFYEITDFSNPGVLLHFGLNDAKTTNYLDPKANFLLLSTKDSSLQKIGPYPTDYFDERRYYSDALFASDGKGNIYFTHEEHDSIYKMNDQGQLLVAHALDFDGEFLKFNKRKETDMSYIRKYSLLTEMNCYIYCLKNDDIVVLKKLAKEGMEIKNTYKYFVLDSNLNIKYTDTVRHSLYPQFVSDYKNGFLLVGDSLKNAFYYEIN